MSFGGDPESVTGTHLSKDMEFMTIHGAAFGLLLFVLFVLVPLVMARVAGFNQLGDDE